MSSFYSVPGPAGTIEIGNVTTGAAGSSAAVTNSGTPTTAILNFTIPQGVPGQGVPTGGTANQVLFKQSGTNYDAVWGPITSAMIGDLEIVNGDVSASAAIAGTKISPNFGSQNVTTTGTSTAASFIPTSSTAPTNGLYLNAANSVALSTNGNGRLFIDSNGNVGVGVANPGTRFEASVSSASVTYPVHISNEYNYGWGVGLKFRQKITSGGALVDSGAITSAWTADNNAALFFSTVAAGSLTERLRITSTGQLSHIGAGSSGSPAVSFSGSANSNSLVVDSNSRVGVGTASPTNPLHVSNTASTSAIFERTGSNGVFVGLKDGSGNFAYLGNTNGAFSIQTVGSGYSDKLVVTSAGLVGIGTSSPSYRFHLARTDAAGDYAYMGASSDNGARGLVFSSADAAGGFLGAIHRIRASSGSGELRLGTSSSDALTIDSSQRVGIGTTSPAAGFGTGVVSLDVVGPIFARGPIASNQTNAGVFQYTGNDTTIRSYGATAGTGAIAFNVGGGGGSADAERARIDSSGRLLVGTASSASQGCVLQVRSDIGVNAEFFRSADNSGGPYIALTKTRGTAASPTEVSSGDDLGTIDFLGYDGATYRSAATIQAQADGTWTDGGDTTDNPGRLVFSTTSDGQASPTPRMTITSAGNLQLGQNFGLLNERLMLSFAAGNTGITTSVASTASQSHMTFYNGAVVGSITTNGSATAYNTSSDYRLKENVTPVTDGIIRLQQLKPSRFNFIVDPDKTVDGFLAHEVQTIVPEAITGEKDAVDDEGNPVYQGIDQSKLVPLLTAALQEAIGEIESLKARLDAANL